MRNIIDSWRLGWAALALAGWACGSGDLVDPSTQGGGGTGGSVTGCDTGPGEPSNNAEATAAPLPAMDDADPSPHPQISGVINGNSDVDWYTYTGSDGVGVVDPHVTFPSDLGLRLCSYFECLALNTLVTCPAGATADRSSAGRLGCCVNAGTVSLSVFDVYCGEAGGGNDDSLRVFIRVDGPGLSASTCVPYTVDYHF